MDNVLSHPAGARVEDVLFNLTALSTRNGKTIDTSDWAGAQQADFADLRAFGFPLLDIAVRSVGALQVNVQYAVPTDPEAQPPTLAFSNVFTFALPAASWLSQTIRITARYARIQVVDTSNAVNNGNYLVSWLRSQ